MEEIKSEHIILDTIITATVRKDSALHYNFYSPGPNSLITIRYILFIILTKVLGQ